MCGDVHRGLQCRLSPRDSPLHAGGVVLDCHAKCADGSTAEARRILDEAIAR